jgi:hypothetical protein
MAVRSEGAKPRHVDMVAIRRSSRRVMVALQGRRGLLFCGLFTIFDLAKDRKRYLPTCLATSNTNH